MLGLFSNVTSEGSLNLLHEPVINVYRFILKGTYLFIRSLDITVIYYYGYLISYTKRIVLLFKLRKFLIIFLAYVLYNTFDTVLYTNQLLV